MRVRILWGSPLPPIRSGVSDYSVELLSELVALADVRLLRPPGWQAPPDWPLEVPVVETDTAAMNDEVTVLNLGNNPYHEWIARRAVDEECVVILHDLVLHHLLVESTLARGDRRSYETLVEQAHGSAGVALAQARRHGVTGRRDPFLFPARRPFLARARGAVVHSRLGERVLRSERPGMPVCRVGLPVSDPGDVDRASAREWLDLDPETVVVMHLGFLTPDKGVSVILSGVAAAAHLSIPVHLVLVGEGAVLSQFDVAVESLGIGDRVSATGWVPSSVFPRLPAAADLGVVLRTPSAGETSAAVVRFLACGTPVAVSGLGQFLEWPEGATPRLTPGPGAAADLARLVVHVAENRGNSSWLDRRRTARATYEIRHHPARAAAALVDFLADLPRPAVVAS